MRSYVIERKHISVSQPNLFIRVNEHERNAILNTKKRFATYYSMNPISTQTRGICIKPDFLSLNLISSQLIRKFWVFFNTLIIINL